MSGDTGATGTTSVYQTAGSRVSKALGNDTTIKQLQKEYTKSNVDKIVIMHENNKQANELMAAVEGAVFKSPRDVVTLFHWLERLIPGGGLPHRPRTLRTVIIGSSTKHTKWETPWQVN